MPSVQFKRGNTATLSATDITDGMIYFNTENKAIYMDNSDTRFKYQTDKTLTDVIALNDTGIPTREICDEILVPYSQAKSVPIGQASGNYIPTRSVLQNVLGNDYLSHGTVVDTISYLTTNKSLFKLIHTFDVSQFTPNSTYEFTVDKDFKFLILIWAIDKDFNRSYVYSSSTLKSLHKIGTHQMQGWNFRNEFDTRGRLYYSSKSGNIVSITFDHYYNGQVIDTDYDNNYILPYQIYTA